MNKVLFLVTGLHAGGAERMLAKLARQLVAKGMTVEVVSLTSGGIVTAEFVDIGVPVHSLGFERPWRMPGGLYVLARLLRRFRPDVIQGWMYHANLMALLGWFMVAGRPRLYWGIRQSLTDLGREKQGTRLVIRLGALMSRWIDGIVYNSELARRQHESAGYFSRHSKLIDNGFETTEFIPDRRCYCKIRGELGLPETAFVIGVVARNHPVKGYEHIMPAAIRMVAMYEDVFFVFVGGGVSGDSATFKGWIEAQSDSSRYRLLNEVADVRCITAAFDVATSASIAEAFPNAVGEAMSCGVPCVATDVGDVRRIVGDCGVIVEPANPWALLEGWRLLRDMPAAERTMLGERARERICQHFSMGHIGDQYANLYMEKHDG